MMKNKASKRTWRKFGWGLTCTFPYDPTKNLQGAWDIRKLSGDHKQTENHVSILLQVHQGSFSQCVAYKL